MSASKNEAEYINGYHASVLKGHAWRTAANSCQHLVPTLKRLAEEKPNIKLLDIGCGSGSITASLAQIIPQGHVTAMDISEEVLQKAAALAESQGVTNISFTTGNVFNLPYEDNTFDAVHAQQLLGHLKDYVSAIKEMIRVTRPAGVVALREMVLRSMSWYPADPLLDKWFSIICQQLEVAGTANDAATIGMKAGCLKAGCKEQDVASTAGTWCWTTDEDRDAWGGSWAGRVVNSDYASRAIESGLATREELLEISQAWTRWKNDPEAWFAVLHAEALIRVQ